MVNFKDFDFVEHDNTIIDLSDNISWFINYFKAKGRIPRMYIARVNRKSDTAIFFERVSNIKNNRYTTDSIYGVIDQDGYFNMSFKSTHDCYYIIKTGNGVPDRYQIIDAYHNLVDYVCEKAKDINVESLLG